MTLKIKDADGATKHVATTGTGTADDPLKTQQSITGAVEVTAISQPLPYGENNIGKVEVIAMPPITVGDITIDDVTISEALPAGENNIGDVDIASFPSSMVNGDRLKVDTPDIRDLSSESDSVSAVQSGTWNVGVSNFPTSFQVSNFPATQTIAGSVSVSNFPTGFQVSNFPSGFQVTNFPATQTVAGSVTVSNFPASFQVSNFPTSFQVSNLPATQTIAGSVGVSNFPTSFQVSNFPATQTIAGTVDLGTTGNLAISSDVQAVRDRLPVTLGTKTAANSLPVTLSSDGAFSTNFGSTSDSAATTDTASFSLIALFKRLLSVTLAKGQAVMASSISVAIASNQTAIPVSTGGLQEGTDITGASIPSGGTSGRGWLSAIWKLLSDRLMPAGTFTPYLGTSTGAYLKTSAGNIYAITCTNLNSTVRYFQVFNQVTAPSLNDVPVVSFPVFASGGLLVIGQDLIGGGGISLSVGISWGISTTALTYTSATANETIATVRWA
ncbi:hypothetical protein LC607_17950 [Nostoc sp. CHAB 5824]|nr:hypothetical protein [Nostoc sp. CHAB 5824]